MLNYVDFINEKILDKFSKNILIDFEIEGDNHFNIRLNREDNQENRFGIKDITEQEVIFNIKKIIPEIVKKNLFGVGIHWTPREDILNKDICIINTDTNLNILLVIRKVKEGNNYKYNFTIKTVMRKPGFIAKQGTVTIRTGGRFNLSKAENENS